MRRRLLAPLVPVYAAGLALKRSFAESRRSSRRSLEHVVISIGSLSAGGAGKTPLVLALTAILRERGYGVRLLTRGYKRGSRAVEEVDPAGDARRFGDEPMLMARHSGVPVYVGADRYRAGRLAEGGLVAGTEEGTVVHLLDDGFQHRQLRRDLDIVLLTEADVSDCLLPAGNLREPLTALREADVIVLREEEAASLTRFVTVLTRESGTPALWTIRRSLHLPVTGAVRPLAFCGIARPEGFAASLAAEGMTTAGLVRFPDHHRYTARDVKRLLRAARAANADGFVTTEKDEVKLTGRLREQLGGFGPLLVAPLVVTLVEERLALEQLISMVPRLDRRRGR